MNFGIVGFGRMGKAIYKILHKKDNITFIIDKKKQENTIELKDITEGILAKTDVIIEFTQPNEAKSILKKLINKKNNLKIVSGTSSWNTKELEKDLIRTNSTLLYASNFSIGINIISKVLPEISNLLSKFDIFDTEIIEKHHKNKIDSPSGTAKTLSEKIKTKHNITSIRSGHYPGTHIISFDSLYENIEIKHTVRDKKLFALGAIEAARLLHTGSFKPGIHNFNELF